MVEESPLIALERLSAEVGVPLEDLQRTVEAALAAAYTRAFAPPGEVVVRLTPVTGAMTVGLIQVAPDGSSSET